MSARRKGRTHSGCGLCRISASAMPYARPKPVACWRLGFGTHCRVRFDLSCFACFSWTSQWCGPSRNAAECCAWFPTSTAPRVGTNSTSGLATIGTFRTGYESRITGLPPISTVGVFKAFDSCKYPAPALKDVWVLHTCKSRTFWRLQPLKSETIL